VVAKAAATRSGDAGRRAGISATGVPFSCQYAIKMQSACQINPIHKGTIAHDPVSGLYFLRYRICKAGQGFELLQPSFWANLWIC